MSSTHRLHPQHTDTRRTKSDAVVAAQPHGRSCSSCLTPLPQFEKPAFHCDPCDYTICASCDRPRSHPAHPDHKLYLIIPISSWRCDACERKSATLEEIQCYHCKQCDFDLCKKCFSGVNSPQHPHNLYRTDVRNVYRQSNGGWACDICRKNNGKGHHYPTHCSSCQFDLCDNCIKPRRTSSHQHVLYKADSRLVYPKFNGTWRCDGCSKRFAAQENNTPFHCSQCEFDLCAHCMETTSKDAAAGSGSLTRSAFHITAIGNPVISPNQVPVGRTGPPDNAGKCVICHTRAKDVTIVHGETGHVCCCAACANIVFRNNGVCPICRAPIHSVIKQYII